MLAQSRRTEIDWFPGTVISDELPIASAPEVVSCANPHAEVVESLRWIRDLIASGRARPDEIAICATSTDHWDEHFLVLRADAGLPVHFSHGVPALASREGQACCALADPLLNGLSQDRKRRLLGHAAGRRRAPGGQSARAAGHAPRILKRARIPQHAFSEADRLLARPDEAAASPPLAAADACWRNWQALTLDEAFLPGTRSWTELAFGRANVDRAAADDLPWSPSAHVVIAGTNIRIQGSIDRLDFNAVGSAVRVSDYKTGAEPRQGDQIVLGRGAELRRVIYALAARQLLPDNPRIVARLVFLGDDKPRLYRLPDVDQAITEIAFHVTAACALLRQGSTLPGPDAREDWNDFRLALPAARPTYFQIKQAALGRAFGNFASVWS